MLFTPFSPRPAVKWLLPLLLLAIVPTAQAQDCSEAQPCTVPVHTTEADGLYFERPGVVVYNVTQWDWHVLDVFNDHDETRTLRLEHYGAKVEAECLACPGTGSDPATRSDPIRFTDAGRFALIEQESGLNITIQVIANDVADVEDGEEPVFTPAPEPTDDVREVPSPAWTVVAALAVVALIVQKRR